jgi:hypothetical protein
MTARILLVVLAAIPAAAQFRAIEVKFQPSECATCTASLPERLKRFRGIETAAVDAAAGVLRVKLAAANRVRLEQIRDALEQDGSKARSAAVEVTGEVSKEGATWIFTPAGVGARYRLEGAGPELAAGIRTIRGDSSLRPADGALAIRVREVLSAVP